MIPVFIVISTQVGDFHDKPLEVFLNKEAAVARQEEIRKLPYMRAFITETTATGKFYVCVIGAATDITPEVYTSRDEADRRYDEISEEMTGAALDEVLVDTQWIL